MKRPGTSVSFKNQWHSEAWMAGFVQLDGTLPLAKNLWHPPTVGVSSFAHLDAGVTGVT
jgi:hypothetical protein